MIVSFFYKLVSLFVPIKQCDAKIKMNITSDVYAYCIKDKGHFGNHRTNYGTEWKRKNK